ncbi:putative ribonuclease H-like domain-containing protein [Tanacetum coccineum]
MVLLRVLRKHNLYTINLNNLSPKGKLACLVAKASVDEYMKWHRRMGHVNYKNMNRLVMGNLVRGLPSKLFKNDHTCVACCKGKQHKASYKVITALSSISEPLQLLHMDLFGPTSIRSIDHKYYCLVITDDYSRFCWVFFLEHKDETYPILKDFLNLVENQLNKKVKAIRCDNGTEFKNAQIIKLLFKLVHIFTIYMHSYLIMTKRGRVHGLRGSSSSTLASGEACAYWFCHYQLGEDCWELYFQLIMTKHIKDGGSTRQSWNNINAD